MVQGTQGAIEDAIDKHFQDDVSQKFYLGALSIVDKYLNFKKDLFFCYHRNTWQSSVRI